MNYGELQARIAADLHRTDLSAQIPDFIDSARLQINARFDLDLVAFVDDADENEVLTEWPLLYVYSALGEGYNWLHNGDAATSYLQRWAEQADRLNITAPGSSVDPFEVPPCIQPYIPEV